MKQLMLVCKINCLFFSDTLIKAELLKDFGFFQPKRVEKQSLKEQILVKQDFVYGPRAVHKIQFIRDPHLKTVFFFFSVQPF